ncbi:flagellar hook-associated protein FlgK [Bacillus shivajii]|uniref:flagellar hook-associated protein FlgK n=1 Tax=Bacillus shivajii TaxID=1983719 RepID=UPI001CFAF88A|nr:flagellar hook-associated protein FlgK [Bacillus shivajii]UCZ52695.1 flagellar hook-associated protein FlgK [Bacillus shivajii]
MKSTFHGLETARRAISTQQTAIQTTGHNIANANTPGYSRQRVNFSTTEAYPSPGFNKPNMPGQLGTGVKAGDIQRVRESFLDMQYREENNKHGYWSARHTALEKMEDIMNEPTEDGLANTMDRFWQSLQDLSVHPEDSGARSVVRQRGLAVAETFNYTHDSLQSIQRDYQSQIGVHQDRVNSLTHQINEINKQIGGLEPHGDLANDLYDQRDLLVDELSQFMNISVEQVSSGGLAKEHADGKYTIKLLDDAGHDMGVTLVDGRKLEANQLHVSYNEDTNLVDRIFIAQPKALEGIDEVSDLSGKGGVKEFSLEDFRSFGELRATIEAYGYMGNDGEEKGLYPDMLHELDQMVATFAEEFNDVHSNGWSLSEIEDGEKANNEEGYNFFAFADEFDQDNGIKGAAKFLKLDDAMNDLDNIAAATEVDGEAFSGDGSNALNLANVKDAQLDFGGTTTNVQSFYQGVIGDMAVQTNEAERMTRNSETLRDSVEDRRESVSGVSLDEEMSNLIQFQHAYNAAARNLTAIDEMLDRIINGMGVVGR